MTTATLTGAAGTVDLAALPTAKDNLAHRLQLARRERGLTQQQVVDHLASYHAIHLARPALSALEGARREVTALELLALANIYACPVEFLLEGTRHHRDDMAFLTELRIWQLSHDGRQQLAQFVQFLHEHDGDAVA